MFNAHNFDILGHRPHLCWRITCAVLLSIASARASTNVTLWSSGTNTAAVEVPAGSVAKVVSFYAEIYPGPYASASLGLSSTNPAASFTVGYTQYNTNKQPPSVAGPATVSLGTYLASAMATVEITCPDSSYAPSAGVVIPSDATGPVNIILESSCDMVNWTLANPGTYGSSATNRFFRVRAVRL